MYLIHVWMYDRLVADKEGGSGVSNEPLLKPKLFNCHGGISGRIGQTAQIEPSSANLNPRSKNPGSAPADIGPKSYAVPSPPPI